MNAPRLQQNQSYCIPKPPHPSRCDQQGVGDLDQIQIRHAYSGFALILGVCLIAITSTWVVAQEHAAPPRQNHFSAEDESLPNPVPVPDDVLAALEKEKPVQDALKDQSPPDNKLPASWFSATEVHLSSGAQPDLVVRAEPPLAGANIDYFWIFRNTAGGHHLVLAAPAHDLEIRAHRSKGFPDIAMTSMTSRQIHTVLYRFDGKHYVVHQEKTEPIK